MTRLLIDVLKAFLRLYWQDVHQQGKESTGIMDRRVLFFTLHDVYWIVLGKNKSHLQQL